MQGELSSKDDTVKELRRWLDQAQGQLQNTQTALHEREAECKTLSADLKAALTDLKTLKVHARLYDRQYCQRTCSKFLAVVFLLTRQTLLMLLL